MKPVFEYTDYRKYLRDFYDWAKAHKRGFSHRAFMQAAGLSGPNYFKRVMEGVHNLTDFSIPKFAGALGLGSVEAEYFRHLVYFNQAETLDEKDRQFEKLMELKAPHAHHLLEKAQYDYYRDWFNVAIREMLAFFDYRGDAAELGKALTPPVPPKKVRGALALLEELKLIEKKSDGGYKPTAAFVLTGPDISSLLIPKFHQAMAGLAQEAITRHPKEERYFSGTTVSISEQAYLDIIEIIRACRKQILGRVEKEDSPERVYHLNMQLFPLTAGKLKKRKKS